MQYEAVLEQIKKGHVRSSYLICGEESFLIRKIEKAIIQATLPPEDIELNTIVYEGDPQLPELIQRIESIPFIGSKNVIIIHGSNLFRGKKAETEEDGDGSGKDEQLLQVLGNMPEYSHVIFTVADKPDKRRKIYKVIEKNGIVAEVASLKPKDVRVWLPEKLQDIQKKMAADAIEYFMSIVSIMSQISLGFLDNELDKAALYAKGPVISKQELQEVLATTPEISVFSMIEALSQKKTSQALQFYGEQVACGEHPLRLLALLARQVRLLWQAKQMAMQGFSNKEIAVQLGLLPFIADKLIRQAGGFSEAGLKQALLGLAEADRKLKNGAASVVTIETIIIDMCH